MSGRQFEIISKYFPDLTLEQEKQLLALSVLYSHWNEQINVISRKDIDELYIRHVLHSLAIAKFVTFQPGSKILDLGTGGGFPGIPLAILFPESEFFLTDSISKKIKVVSEVAKSIDLLNVRTAAVRTETVTEQFDFVVTRAVARAAKLRNWCRGKFLKTSQHPIKNGIIALKGGDLSEELVEMKRPYIEVAIQDYFNEPFFETKKIIYISAS